MAEEELENDVEDAIAGAAATAESDSRLIEIIGYARLDPTLLMLR